MKEVITAFAAESSSSKGNLSSVSLQKISTLNTQKANSHKLIIMNCEVKLPKLSVKLNVQKKSPLQSIVPNNTSGQIHFKYAPCPEGGKHTMVGRGTGFTYRGAYLSTDLVIRGFCSQCSKCGEFIISEYCPFWDGVTKLGTYAEGQANYALSNVSTSYYTNDFYYNDSLAQDPYFRSFVW